MDLYRVIFELLQERNRLQKIIDSLERMAAKEDSRVRPQRKHRGRKSMDSAARREVSERMKRYWAKRRAELNASRELETPKTGGSEDAPAA